MSNEVKDVKIKIIDIGGVDYKFTHKNSQPLNNRCLLLLSQIKYFVNKFIKYLYNFIVKNIIKPPIDYIYYTTGTDEICGFIFVGCTVCIPLFGSILMIEAIVNSPYNLVSIIMYHISIICICYFIIMLGLFYIIALILFMYNNICKIIKYFYNKCTDVIIECNEQIPIMEEI